MAATKAALEAGAEDFKNDESSYEVITAPADFEMVKKVLEDAKVEMDSAEVTMVPQNKVHLTGRDAEVALKLLDALEVFPRLALHLFRQRLDEVAAAERIDHVREVRFLAQDVLRVNGDARAEVGRARQRLVVGVGVKRLQSAEDAGHRLHRHPRDVVQRLLFDQVIARGVGMGSEMHRRGLGGRQVDRSPPGDRCGRGARRAGSRCLRRRA